MRRVLTMIAVVGLIGCGDKPPTAGATAMSIDELIETLTVVRDELRDAKANGKLDPAHATDRANLAAALWNSYLNDLDDIPDDDPELERANAIAQEIMGFAHDNE